MQTKYAQNGLTWIDLENPSGDEIALISKQYGLHPLVSQELQHPSLRPRVEKYHDHIYLILHFPTHGQNGSEDLAHEIDFILGTDYIITIHYDRMDPLRKFSKIFEVNTMVDHRDIEKHAGYLFYYMMRSIYNDIGNELDQMGPTILDIEKSVFSTDGKAREVVWTISEFKRNLMDFRQSLRYHEEVLESFQRIALTMFGNDFEYYLHSIISEYYKVQTTLAGHKEIIDDLAKTHDSLVGTRTSEVIKVLTIVAFTALPITIIAQIFGMNLILPLAENPHALWTVIGISLIISTGLFAFFKLRRWL